MLRRSIPDLRRRASGRRAAIFVAYHIPPASEGVLHKILAGAGQLRVKLAEHGEPIRRGNTIATMFAVLPPAGEIVAAVRERLAR